MNERQICSDAKTAAPVTASTSKTVTLPRSGSSSGKDTLKESRSDETHPENQVEYKNGWVMRKSVRTEHGKKSECAMHTNVSHKIAHF